MNAILALLQRAATAAKRGESAFYILQCCGSGIRCFFTPWIRDGAMVGSGSGIRDKQTKFLNSLYTKIGRIRDPGLFYPRIRDKAMVGSGSGIRDKNIPDPQH
jgi:hypothetical protein